LISTLDGGEWQASRPGHFSLRESDPGTHWIGGWVGPRAVLDTVVKRKVLSPAGNRIYSLSLKKKQIMRKYNTHRTITGCHDGLSNSLRLLLLLLLLLLLFKVYAINGLFGSEF
jgi:hypothetical protein